MEPTIGVTPTGEPCCCVSASESDSDSDESSRRRRYLLSSESDSDSVDNDPCASLSSSSEATPIVNSTSCICDGSQNSSSDESVFSAGMIQNDIDNGKDILVGSGDDGYFEEYDLDVSFSEMTYLNVWGIFALMMLLNVLCCFVCYKKKRMEQMRDIDDLNAANMEIVS